LKVKGEKKTKGAGGEFSRCAGVGAWKKKAGGGIFAKKRFGDAEGLRGGTSRENRKI